MAEKIISIDLNDPRSAKIAEVIRNKTCKRILGLIAEKEVSESEISSELSLPMNTIGYNVKKLVDSGLIEETGKFLWSVKGKKIRKYKLANKRIVIYPKNIIKGIVPAIVLTALTAVGIKIWSSNLISRNAVSDSYGSNMLLAAESTGKSADAAAGSSGVASLLAQNVWLWFLVGALFALLVYLLWNVVRMRREYDK